VVKYQVAESERWAKYRVKSKDLEDPLVGYRSLLEDVILSRWVNQSKIPELS